MMNLGFFRGGKRIDPPIWKRKRPDKFTNVRCGPFVPIILHANVEGLSTNKNCVIRCLAGSTALLRLSTKNLPGP